MANGIETVIISDLHGTYWELQELLSAIDFGGSAKLNLIFLGDLGDRGDYSYECVQLVKSLCEKGLARCCQANHESKHIRYRNHLIRKQLTGIENPMRPLHGKDLEFHNKLTDDDISWMRNLPTVIRINDDWLAIHAGVEPYLPLAEQDPNQLMRVRYVSDGNYISKNGTIYPKGKAVPLSKDRGQPSNSVYWTDLYEGTDNIVFGHFVHSLHTPFVEIRPNGAKCIGIDCGAVFGGNLVAYHLERNEFTQVKAKKEYAKLVANFEE